MKNIQKTHFNNQKDYSKNVNFKKDYRLSLMLEILKKLLKKNSKLKVLDIGVGDGYMYKYLTDKHDIYGVDISENLIKVAKKNGIKGFVSDLEKERLPFKNESFDIIITGETIEHIVNTDFFLSEINRVLKINGKIILSYPNINTPLGVAMMILLDLPPMYSSRFRSPHVRDWTKKTIKKALKNFEFKVEKVYGSSFYLPGIGFFNPLKIARIFPRISNSAVVVSSKINNKRYDENKVIEL